MQNKAHTAIRSRHVIDFSICVDISGGVRIHTLGGGQGRGTANFNRGKTIWLLVFYVINLKIQGAPPVPPGTATDHKAMADQFCRDKFLLINKSFIQTSTIFYLSQNG
jgi:hypothetical protein